MVKFWSDQGLSGWTASAGLGTGKSQILTTRTTNMESQARKLWPFAFAFKLPVDQAGSFFIPINIVTLTRRLQGIHIKYQLKYQ